MKQIKKLLIATFVALALAMVCPSVIPNVGITNVEAAPKLTKKKLTLTVGKTYTLKMKGTNTKATWSTSNKKVIKLTSKKKKSVKLNAKKAGTATVTAKIGKKKYKCKVTVKKASVPVTGITLNYSNLTLKEGNSQTISTYVNPTNATSKTVTWKSSNTTVATVASGKVTAVSPGTATITATCGGKTATCSVTVNINFSESVASSSISYQSYAIDDGAIIIAKNNYKYAVSLRVTTAFYRNGTLIDSGSDSNYCLEPGKECALFTYGPGSGGFTSHKVLIVATESSAIGNVGGISYSANFGVGNVMVAVTNRSNTLVEFTTVAIVFYKNGKPVGYDYNFAEVDKIGQTDYLSFSFPYDSNYDDIIPDSFKVFINNSYGYSW